MISIHAPREGSDICTSSTIPSGGDFYPRSPRGERRAAEEADRRMELISIHAPREGSDRVKAGRTLQLVISIHAPREGSDVLSFEVTHRPLVFLSTLPARGAT